MRTSAPPESPAPRYRRCGIGCDVVSRVEAFPVGASVTRAEIAADPHPALARLRATEPVSWVPELGYWLVTSRDAALRVLRDARAFTVDDPRFSTAQVVGPRMLSLDGLARSAARVVAETLGIPDIDTATVLRWCSTFVAAVSEVTAGGAVPPAAPAAFESLAAHVLTGIDRNGSLLAEAVAGGLGRGEAVSNAA